MLYENWLRPIIKMIQEGEFDEVCALAKYFPETHNKKIVQFVALLGQNNIKEANFLLSQFTCEAYKIIDDVTIILSQVNFDFSEVTLEAIHQKHYNLGIFCIEFQLWIHLKVILLVADINNLVKQLTTLYLKSKNLFFLNKAFSLLNLVNHIKQDNIQRFTKALVELESTLDILEYYGYVILELNKSLQYKPKNRAEVLKLYIHLSKIADKNNDLELSRKFLIAAINLSGGLREFSKNLSYEISKDIKLPNFANYNNKKIY